MTIAIVDYGMGNLRSVAKAFEHLGFRAEITRNPRSLETASRVVLPGVGAFPDCMRNLTELGLIGPIRDSIRHGKPFLGICLGLQLLFSESEEFGIHPGMDLLKGRVVRFSPSEQLKVPHMGWNRIERVKKSPILEGIDDKEAFYFVHSYYVVPQDSGIICTQTNYGVAFASSIQAGNIFACQFHPEKSQQAGLRMMKNFAQWIPQG